MTPAPVKLPANQSGVVGVTPGVPGMNPMIPKPKISVRMKDRRPYERAVMVLNVGPKAMARKLHLARLSPTLPDTEKPN